MSPQGCGQPSDAARCRRPPALPLPSLRGRRPCTARAGPWDSAFQGPRLKCLPLMPPPLSSAGIVVRSTRSRGRPGMSHSSPGAPASALTPAISGSAAHDPHFFPPSPDVPRFLFPQGLCLFRASASSGLLRPIQTGEPATRAAELRPAQRGAARALLPSPSHLPGALTLAWIGLGSSVTIKYWVTLLAKLCVGPPCYWLPCSSHLRLSV